MTFSNKLREARKVASLTQRQLAEMTELSQRTIAAYETGSVTARRSNIAKLARALKVSVKYLSDERCTDPLAEIEKDVHIEEARALYGSIGVREVDALLRDNAALFAGGKLSQEQKALFFEAVMRAYLACKEEARIKYGRRNDLEFVEEG